MLYHDLWDASFQTAPGRWSLWRCAACRSAYLDPRPTQSSLGRAYERYYTHAQSLEFEEPGTIHAKGKRALANGYRNARYGGNLTPSSRLGSIVGTLLPRLRHHIDYKFRYLPKPRAGSRLLDVGSGSGDFLRQASAAGWDACGVDPDPVAVARAAAHGFQVRTGTIQAWADAPGSFDAITMNHVIEHVPDPSSVLEAAFNLLRPGGTLFIDTPHIDAPTHARFGRNWRGLEVPRHLLILSRKALVDLLQGAGFGNIRWHSAPGAAEYLIAASEEMAALDGSPLPDSTSNSNLSETEFLTLTCKRPQRSSRT